MRTVIPAFMISENQDRLPNRLCSVSSFFLVIDMVVSSVLLSMGMMQLPPAVVSLPFKSFAFSLWSLAGVLSSVRW